MSGPGLFLWRLPPLLGVALMAAGADATTIRVPQHYPTIQDGLNAGALGDTVLVAPGTYSDYVVQGVTAAVARPPDGVVLLGEGGPSQTIIDLAPLEGAASGSIAFGISGHSSGQTVVEGFHVINMPPTSNGASIGYCEHVEIRNCIFEVPEGSPLAKRIGIVSVNADVRVASCTFLRCEWEDGSGSGISHAVGPLVVEDCSFIECRSASCIYASEWDTPGPYPLIVRNCLFQRCVSTSSGGGIQSSLGGGTVIEGCVFEEMDVAGGTTKGAAAALGGFGPKTIRNNLFRNMDFTDGQCCLFIRYNVVEVSGNTFVDIHQPPPPPGRPAVILYTPAAGTNVSFTNNIVAHSSGQEALSGATVFTSDCNVFWDNADGIGIELSATDRIADPQFCDPVNRDYSLQATSPCLPSLSLGCGLIGALNQGCGTVSLSSKSWGKIKADYRTGEEE